MSTPLNDIPELRATFKTDSLALLERATQQFAQVAAADFSVIPALHNTIHSLRGAAAMIGAASLTALMDDYQRLLEIADSFRLTAGDKAQEAYAFLRRQLDTLRRALLATIDSRSNEVKECADAVHQEALKSWGGYFYSPAEPTETADKPAAKTLVRPVRPKAGGHRRPDDAVIAREFLNSLGVNAAEASVTSSLAPSTPSLADQIDPEMLTYFVIETGESLAQMEKILLVWEKNGHDTKAAHSIFRLVHTIKGAANSLGLNRIGQMLHELEDLMETHVVDRIFPQPGELVEVILGVSDTVKILVREAQTRTVDPVSNQRVQSLLERIKALGHCPPPLPAPAVPEISLPAAPLVASSLAQAAMLVPEAPLVLHPEVPEPAPAFAPVPVPEAKIPEPARSEPLEHPTIRVDSDRLDLLMNLIGELVISRSRLEKKLMDISRLKDEMAFGKTRLIQAITDFQERYEYSHALAPRHRLPGGVVTPGLIPALPEVSGFSELEFDQYDDFNILARTLMEIGTDTGEIFTQLNGFFDAFGEETGQFSKITARLQDEITRVRMMPLTLLFQRLRRSVRDAARKERKEINFLATDNDTRLDKLIHDQLYSPLLHIVRNAVSHGIEPAAERQAAGKDAVGQIHLRAACDANHIVLEVSDDGRGLDLAEIRATAIRRGLLAADAPVNEATLTQLIFQPGFSTAEAVTDVSGRGVGLDVVRQEISRLSGSVQVQSVPGQGCTFIIHLPLTLAINQAMFVTTGNEICALPLNFVERIQEGQLTEFARSGQQELVRTPEGLVPLLRLNQLLQIPGKKAGEGSVVLARVANRRLALGVDRILRKQDIVVKPLGPLLKEHPLFSGATIGGDGQAVLILDLPRLLDNEQFTVLRPDPEPADTVPLPESARTEQVRILVVDDSLSVRKVIEKHLLSLQFQVELAVDGLDALEKLRLRRFDVVLTDLEMPRLNGFELVAEMRRQDGLRSVPVIVVTSRDAEKHRRRAATLGANDYVIKPFSRDQLGRHINQLLNRPNR